MHSEAKYWYALSKAPGIGSANFTKLLEYFKLPYAAWQASADLLSQVSGLDKVGREKFLQYREATDIDEIWASFLQSGVQLVTLADQAYPEALRHIHNPPPVLYYRGSLVQLQAKTIAIVGSRRCTAYGRHVAEQLARELAEAGFVIVSGMARGIDSAAHKGALQRGQTIAVLGSGVDIIYPPENKELYWEISQNGAVISEYSPGTPVFAGHFPARNRIISGLSSGIVVIEAAEKSGALITVDFALEQGREVYAVPGCITNQSSKGTHKLIQQGAKLVASVADILEDYDLSVPKQSAVKSVAVEMRLDEQNILGYLGITAISIDQLIQQSGWEASRIHSILLDLEIKGLIESLPGKRFKLADAKGLWR